MTTECPNCRRTQPETAGAAFCIYCGHRVGSTGGEAAVSSFGNAATATGGYDPNATGDMPTQAYTGSTAFDPQTYSTPTRVGPYRLIRKLGSGGMGAVYEAESTDSSEHVAVKLLSPKLAANPTSLERFRQEGRLASQISHPRCVFVYGADTDGGRPYIVMELMPGDTLKELVDLRGPLPPGEAVARTLDVIDGLAEAHRLGMIHRDVKPSNCFLTADDRVKVGDFGLSKSLAGSDADAQLTGTGAFLGTVLFASPEQIRGDEVGYDSDVYSVCATLYYLLAGQAPYQHHSITAALAKAISEPPPSLRIKRPDVSKRLDRVIQKGLERDRGRRYATLEDLRDALAEELPGRQLPPRRRTLVAAYVVDSLLLMLLVQIPIELLEYFVAGKQFADVRNMPIDPVQWFFFTGYFALCEGLLGTTLGKWLLRLRVIRVGAVGPPGLWPATVRAVLFNLMWIAALILPFALDEWTNAGPWIVLLSGSVGLTLLWQQFRRGRECRGLHDFGSGCRVVQLPRPPHRVRLRAGVTAAEPVTPDPDRPILPAVVGGFTVKGSLLESPAGMVWAAEDKSLGRRILLWVRPDSAVPDEPQADPVRPGRLRAAGRAYFDWNGGSWAAAAYVVPAGAPLLDSIDPKTPLPWADARQLLEQVIDELRAATADGSLPPRFGLDQLWAEPTGRLHLTDFPLPTARPAPTASAEPLGLIRQAASLMLEGKPRKSAGPLAAAVPPHAAAVMAKLFTPNGFDGVAGLHAALAETHAFPPRVTGGMRAAHLGLTAALAGVGLVLMFVAAFGMRPAIAAAEYEWAWKARFTAESLNDPAAVEYWRSTSGRFFGDSLDPGKIDTTRKAVDALAAQAKAEAEASRDSLSRPEKYLIDAANENADRTTDALSRKYGPHRAIEVVQVATNDPSRPPAAQTMTAAKSALIMALVGTLAVCVGTYSAFAFAFRGGFAFMLAGLSIVRRDGRPAGRFQCVVRECCVWLPLASMLLVAAAVQLVWPGWFFGRLIAFVGCLGAVVAGVLMTIGRPERGPHDRLAGTYVVPM